MRHAAHSSPSTCRESIGCLGHLESPGFVEDSERYNIRREESLGRTMLRTPGARIAAAAAVMLWTFAASALAQQIEVLWLGHSAFRITSTTGKVIVIDPFLKKNLRTPAKYKDLSALGKVDLILVTHGHGDHVADLGELASLTGAIVVANFELANNLVALGVLEGSKTIAMNQGGTVAPLGPGIKVH